MAPAPPVEMTSQKQRQDSDETARAGSAQSGIVIADGRLSMQLDRYGSMDKEASYGKPSVQWDKSASKGDDVRLAVNDVSPILMDSISADKQMNIDILNVSASVPPMFGNKHSIMSNTRSFVSTMTFRRHQEQEAKKRKETPAKDSYRRILYNVNASCKPGEVLALMGPSGSGKTSLLSVMGNRIPKLMKVEGVVHFNGEKLTKRAKRQIGFVLQDDLLYEALTVYETLYYAALLRLPRHMSHDQKVERVLTVITALGLERCKDTIIGGFFRRGVSGGERKRVSVGHELLINPSILLLDEPTSGLDSTTAMHLVETLRTLATGGRAVVTTIHQPSSRLYLQLDKVLLLSQGHVMYYGRGAKVADFFSQLGYRMPYGVNAADFILDLASGEVLTKERENGESGRLYLIRASERYLEQEPEGYTGEVLSITDSDTGPHLRNKSGHVMFSEEGVTVNSKDEASTSSSHESDGDIEDGKAGAVPGGLASLKNTSRWGASYTTQFKVLFTRSLKTRRFESLSKQDIVQFLAVGFIVACIWWQAADTNTIAGARNVIGILFFQSLFLAFRAMFSALFTFPNEFKMMLKERASGMYRLSAFYFARTASDLPMDWSMPSIFLVIVYFSSGLRLDNGAFFANWAINMLNMTVAQSFGLLIGATVMHPKTAQTITAVIMLTFMLIGGFYVTNIPAWISWLKYLSFVYYGYNALIKIEFGDRQFYDCINSSAVSFDTETPQSDPLCKIAADNKAALNLQEDPNDIVWDVIPLLGYLVLFRILVYVALRKKTSKV